VSGYPLSRPLMSGNKAARHAFECLARLFSCPQPERADLPRVRLRPRGAFLRPVARAFIAGLCLNGRAEPDFDSSSLAVRRQLT
jgi:hypothetical protein